MSTLISGMLIGLVSNNQMHVRRVHNLLTCVHIILFIILATSGYEQARILIGSLPIGYQLLYPMCMLLPDVTHVLRGKGKVQYAVRMEAAVCGGECCVTTQRMAV